MAKQKKQRTTEGLRDLMFEEIDALRDGSGDPKRARTIAALSREILSTVRLDLQFHQFAVKMQHEGANVSFQPLALGSK